MLTFDTAERADAVSEGGRDLYVWGSNRSYELGKRSEDKSSHTDNHRRTMFPEANALSGCDESK